MPHNEGGGGGKVLPEEPIIITGDLTVEIPNPHALTVAESRTDALVLTMTTFKSDLKKTKNVIIEPSKITRIVLEGFTAQADGVTFKPDGPCKVKLFFTHTKPE